MKSPLCTYRDDSELYLSHGAPVVREAIIIHIPVPYRDAISDLKL